ncbi:MAG: HAD-IIA family hydrolase [Anaerolineae bacterium]
MSVDLKGVIFDIDGVLEFRGQVYPGAIEAVAFLRERGIAVRFLTNSTLKSRASAADKLRRRGFVVEDEEVITASYATAQYLRGLHPRSCWIMLDGEGHSEFDGLPQDEEDPEYVVVGDYRSRFDFDHMNRALRLLLGGATLVGIQSELLDLSAGEAELNVGSWAGMLERAAGVQAIYVGKPSPYVFQLAVESMGLEKYQVLMVGDKTSSDIRGANDFGIRSALVRTGEYEGHESDPSARPDFILDSIMDVPSLFAGATHSR